MQNHFAFEGTLLLMFYPLEEFCKFNPCPANVKNIIIFIKCSWVVTRWQWSFYTVR